MVARLLTTLLSNPIALIGAASPFILNHLQSNAARLQAAEQTRVSELTKANTLFMALSNNMDLLAFYNRSAAFALVLRGGDTLEQRLPLAIDQLAWSNFQTQWGLWNGSLGQNTAGVANYFGTEASGELEKIQIGFSILNDMVEATYFMRTENQYFLKDENDLRTKYFETGNAFLSLLNGFNTLLLQQIKTQQVGSLRSIAA